MKLFVGNLSFSLTEDELRETFEEYGEVESANILLDRETNRSRGFGFIEMPDVTAAKAAVRELDGQAQKPARRLSALLTPRTPAIPPAAPDAVHPAGIRFPDARAGRPRRTRPASFHAG